MILIFIFLACAVGGWFLFTSIFDVFVPKESNEYESTQKNTYINHNYITENHLHISKEDLKALSEKKSNTE